MAAEDSIRAIDRVIREGLHHTPIMTGQATAAQTWLRGAILVATTAGRVSEAATDDVTLILGVALHDVTAATVDDAVQFVPALPHLSFEATLEDNANGDHALLQTNVWDEFALRQHATNGLWYLDENDETAVAALVTGLVDPVGTVQGRVRFQFKPSTTIWT